MNAASLKARILLLGFLFAILFKFWLIWESEIADASDDPHEYVLQILYPVNGGLAYPPGTGLVGLLFYNLGIPFRLGLEATFLLAATLVIGALIAWPWKSGLALGLFSLLIFDPAVADLFSHLFSDDIWLVETLIGLSCVVFALRNEFRPNWILLNVAALVLGLSTLTRSTFIPLMLGLVLFAGVAMALVFLQYRGAKAPSRPGVLALSMVSLLLVIGIIYEGACVYNLRSHGYNGISAIDSSEYKTFYFCLQSVGDPTGKRYFPIDENRRALIAQAGPVSKRFMSEMDRNGYFKKVGLENYGTADIASGWLEFALFIEAYQEANGDLQKCFALFETIEKEIAESHRHGLLKVRTVIPLPDTRIAIVAAAYPGALLDTVREIAHEPPPSALAMDPVVHYDDPDFTVALHRRVIHDSPFRHEIWNFLNLIYGLLYTPFIVYTYLVVWLFFFVALAAKWSRIQALPLDWMAQQLFGLFFVVLIAWYALFDASGWPALFRYMIFNHVMLPVLLAYYLAAMVRLLRHDRLR